MKPRKCKTSFAVADSETDPFVFGRVPKPFIWGYYDGLKFKTFRTTKEFVEHIRDIKITIYAHNGGKFDWMFLLDYLDAYYRPTIINGRLSKLKVGKATLVDSYNILPIALKDYQKDEIDYEIFEENLREKHIEEITDYLRSDCVYLYDLVKSYRDEYGADLTQAGGSIKTFQKMRAAEVGKDNSKVPRHKDKAMFANFKNFYHGGRVECFRLGIIDEKSRVVDINSAYPFAMTYKHPFGLDFVYGDREIPFSESERTFYRLECISHGALPYRAKPNSGLSFPNDDEIREFYITDWEYWTAKNAKLISAITIIECVTFSDTLDFSEYVYKFYNGRKQAKRDGDKAKDLLYKLRLNSLYGKFGSDYRKYENYLILPDDVGDIDGWEKLDKMGDKNSLHSCPLSDDEMNFYNVATAASITGFVRAYLLAAMVNIGFANMLYCDTDSMAVLENSPLHKIPMGDDLGNWKDEGIFKKSGIAGKKLYIFKKWEKCPIYILDKKKKPETLSYKKACKGVDLTENQLWKVCRGGKVAHKKASPSFSMTGKSRFTKRTVRITK